MCVSINGPGDLDLETGVQVASKVGNLPSKFGHARPLDSRIIRHVRDGLMDRQKQRLLPPPLPYGRGHNNHNSVVDTSIFCGAAAVVVVVTWRKITTF